MANRPQFTDIKTLTIAGAILVIGVLLLAGIASLTSLQQTPIAGQPTLTPSLEAATIVDRPVGDVVTEPVYLTYAQPSATIIAPGATYIQPYFDRMDIAPGDIVTVSAADGTQLRTYNAGDQGKWAFPVEGGTAVVTLVPADRAATQYGGVGISQYGRGLTEPELAQSLCGSNDLTDVICSASSFPIEYGLRQPVARMLYTSGGAQYVCTTWRVTPGNFMVTNEHCVKSQAVLDTAVIRFNYQRASCGAGSSEPYTEVRGGSLLYVNATYDVALYTLREDDFPAVQQYGYLELDARAPAANETIFIPQHPAGMPKQFGLNSAQDGGRCRVMASSLAGYAPGSDFGYSCDTQGGSSGSPVIALDTLRVVGLHHLGSGRPDGSVCGPSPHYNQAVKVEHIAPLLAPYLGAAIAPGLPTPSVTVSETPQPSPTETFTPSNTPTPSLTPTLTHTPTATPLRASIELVNDGGFEARSEAWVLANGSTGDKNKPRKARSGTRAFQMLGGEAEKTRLSQAIVLDGIVFQAGDQLELIAHMDTKRDVRGAMRFLVTYADGRRVKERVAIRPAGRYEPRAISVFLDSADVTAITIVFRNKSLDPSSRILIDDVSVLHSRALP